MVWDFPLTFLSTVFFYNTMARKLSTRKRPPREVKQLKERRRIEEEVFDRPTLLSLSKMIEKGVFDSLDYPIATGKEANVFRATTEKGHLAVKIYRIETATFKHMRKYMEGDRRFQHIKGGKKNTIFAWAQKEFKNLMICKEAGIHAPRPILFERNILVMEFLGEEGLPYSTMNLVGSENPKKDLESILTDVKKLYKAGLVHADISEFNIMQTKRGPYLIDVGQGVLLNHPMAEEFLLRDVNNILRYFKRKYGIRKDVEKVLMRIKGLPNRP